MTSLTPLSSRAGNNTERWDSSLLRNPFCRMYRASQVYARYLQWLQYLNHKRLICNQLMTVLSNTIFFPIHYKLLPVGWAKSCPRTTQGAVWPLTECRGASPACESQQMYKGNHLQFCAVFNYVIDCTNAFVVYYLSRSKLDVRN